MIQLNISSLIAALKLEKDVSDFSLCLLSGLLLGASFLSQWLWPLALFGLVPFLQVLFSQEFRKSSCWNIFLHGWFFGFVFIGTVIVWFWQAYPFSWPFRHEALALPLILAIWSIVAITLSVVFGFLSLAITKLTKPNWTLYLTVPALWVLSEYLRMWVFFVVTYGSGTLVGAHFSVGFLGYSLAPNPLLLQLASWGGVYALSFSAVLVNLWLYKMYTKEHNHLKFAVVVAGVTLLLQVGGVIGVELMKQLPSPTNQDVVRTALLTTNFSNNRVSTRERHIVYTELLSELSESDPEVDLVFFPEAANFVSKVYQNPDSILNKFSSSTVFIDSMNLRQYDDTVIKSIYQYSSLDKLTHVREKQFFVPVGEYMPNIIRALFKLTGVYDDYVASRGNSFYYVPGEHGNGLVTNGDNVKVQTLLCSEILSPSLYNKSGQPAAILANLSSHSYFHQSGIVFNQVLSMARVQAVYNNKPFVQAANGAPSFVLDRKGQVIAMSAGAQTVVTVELPISKH